MTEDDQHAIIFGLGRPERSIENSPLSVVTGHMSKAAWIGGAM